MIWEWEIYDHWKREKRVRKSINANERERWSPSQRIYGELYLRDYHLGALPLPNWFASNGKLEINSRISGVPPAVPVSSSKLAFFVVAHLQAWSGRSRGSLRCAIWGLTRSLGSYLSSFLTKTFETHNEKVRVLAYTNVGLILIGLGSDLKNPTYYVANPISQQCVKIPPRPLRPLGQQEECFRPGLVTRIEKDVLLGYKVVLMDRTNIRTGVLSLVVYSSETGLWSFNTLQSHPQLHYMSCIDPITLNGNIYWIGVNLD